MPKKELNLKNMVEAYIRYSDSEETMDKIWYNFYDLCLMGFISNSTWYKFADKVGGLTIEDIDTMNMS